MKAVHKILLIFLITIFVISGGVYASPAGTEDPVNGTEPEEANTGVFTGTVKTGDFSMDYCRFGNGERTLVILPGLSIQNLMDSAEAVAESFQLFTEEFTVYLFERRRDLPARYTVYDMAEDTTAALQALGLEHISIYGVSYGGMAAMELAILHPELTEKIILASTTCILTEDEYRNIEKWIGLAENNDAQGLYLAFGKDLYSEEVYEQSKELLIEAAKTVTEEDLRRFIILAEGMKGFNISDDLKQIRCPVFAIGDKQDKLLGPEAAENIGLYMNPESDFTIYMYDGYGHAVYDTAPDFKERMASFLAE